jgi:hypothetical protein
VSGRRDTAALATISQGRRRETAIVWAIMRPYRCNDTGRRVSLLWYFGSKGGGEPKIPEYVGSAGRRSATVVSLP